VLASVADVLQNSGYSTLTANSGSEGLRLVRTASVDVVVLDYEMPQMKGDVVAQAIRRHKPRLPIILFTGAPDHVPERLRQEVNAVACKADFAGLLVAVKKLVERPAEKEAPNGIGG
jgi:CheY-like chemotaxis protein